MSERPPISPRSPRAALEPEQVPPPPKRSERARNPLVVVGNAVITIVLLVIIGAGAAYIYGKQKIEAPGPLQEDRIVNIPARAGMTDIADILQREGVIDNNRWAFIGSVFALKARSELKPGEYSFQKSASLRDVIGTIVDGKVDERSRVAAVFVNRLRQKIKLQSEPTSIYGLVGGRGTLGRPIKRSEIQQPSPYNTYVVDGLPPGPIANPGRASLEAAANPARTRDLFFVADGT